MNKIEITIHQDGQVELDLSGFNDCSCLDTTSTIEHLLGNEIINRRFLNNQLSETITLKKRNLEH